MSADNATAADSANDSAVGDDPLAILQHNTDGFFLVINAFIIFFMQCGFAFLEAGSVRTKNTVNILIKNILDSFLGGVAYWAVGWALAYGPEGNGFCGGAYFFSYGMPYSKYPMWFFQFVFAATSATIVSGSLAERGNFVAYFIYSVFISAWVYPVVSHWVWDVETPGWLFAMGYHDFAGSSVVHMVGGVIALVACILVGPRTGRFDPNGKPVDIPGHSVPLVGLGGFVLLFGFLAFNGGSQTSITKAGDAEAMGRAVVNTILGGCSSGLTVLILNRIFFSHTWSYLMTLNGSLAGMVAMCAGCNVYQPWAAQLVGIFGGCAFLQLHFVMLKFKFDDPLDAVAVHCGGGIVGIISVHFLAYETGILWAGDTIEAWRLLGVNVLGAVVITAWSAFWALFVFLPLRWLGLLRVDRETEFRGNDLVKHGESAYPRDAWVELQYNNASHGHAAHTPALMAGTHHANHNDNNARAYNNAFEMMPTEGKLFSGLSNTMFAVTNSLFGKGNERPHDATVANGIDNRAYNVY